MAFPTAPLSGLSKEARYELLAIARRALSDVVRGVRQSEPEVGHRALADPGAAFVTLFRDRALRGCRGCLEANQSLVHAVQQVTGDAALRDPRFESVTVDEVEGICIEISVLGAFQEVDGIEDIEIGRHGVLVRQGWKGGLLLPQVAGRYGWDAATFVGKVCRKANLHKDAWKEPEMQIWIFETEIFGEE